jgi:hypothetical protein
MSEHGQIGLHMPRTAFSDPSTGNVKLENFVYIRNTKLGRVYLGCNCHVYWRFVSATVTDISEAKTEFRRSEGVNF